MNNTECAKCHTLAHEWALDNMLDHLGIRIPAAEAKALGYNMRRDYTQSERDEAARWADGWLAAGLAASTGSDCGEHA